MEYKSIGQALDIVDKEEGIVSGYLSAFGNIDSDGDMIMPGAFKRTIQEWGPTGRKRIKHLIDHDNTKSVGVFTVLKEDDYGLYYESKVGDWTDGVDFWKKIKAGAITEHSIGFKSIRQEKASDHNKITEIKLYEGSSLNGWGANEFTPVNFFKSMKDFDTYFEFVIKGCKEGTLDQQMLTRLEEYCKSLQPYFKTIEPGAEGNAILPDESKSEGDKNEMIYNAFKTAFGND